MARIYDAAKHAELTELQVKIESDLAELGIKLMDEYESDGWGGDGAPGKIVRYSADQQRHAQLGRDLERTQREWQIQEDLKPVTRQQMANTPQDAMRRWFLKGRDGLETSEVEIYLSAPTPEMLDAMPLMAAGGGDVFNPFALLRPQMAASDPMRSDVAVGAEGLGAAAPETWAGSVVEALQYAGSVAASCHNFTTGNGNDLHQNQLDTKDEEGGTIIDQTQVAGVGIPPVADDQIGPVGDIVFKAYIRHSNFISQRLETFTDIHFDVASRIIRETNRRMGRGWNNWFTKGTGVNQPQGLITSAKETAGGANSAGKITYANLLDMEYAIDLAYLQGDEGFDGGFSDGHGGIIGWMMNRKIERLLRSALMPTSNLPLWVPNLESGAAIQGSPGLIMGYPYSLNQHMDDGAAASNKPIAFGNYGHYSVRNIGGPMFYRFWDSATAAQYAVKYIAFSRRDGRSQGPVVATLCPAYTALKVA